MINPKNVTIGKKLIVSFLCVAAGLLAIGMIGWSSISSMERGIINMAENRIPDLQCMNALNKERMAIRAQTLDVWIEENSDHSIAVASYRRIQQERKASWARVDENMRKLKSIPRQSEKGRDLMSKIEPEYEAWRRIYVELDALIEKLAGSANSAKRAELYKEYRTVTDRMIPISDAFGRTIEELAKNNNENTTRMAMKQVEEAVFMERIIIICTFLGVFAAMIFGLMISRSIVNPMRELTAAMDKLATGDVDVTINAGQKDEIGNLADSLKRMAENTRATALAVEKIAGGDLRVKATILSDRDVLGRGLNQAVDAVKALVDDANMLSRAAVEGKLATRADASRHQGD
ncbi:MAG TPA: MCP four helix bundle domain-containing protein, partial [Smithellaceae bacterium]|nr:MCP four helix bundle domain-containing protein [Smithellaceae bacterium]